MFFVFCEAERGYWFNRSFLRVCFFYCGIIVLMKFCFSVLICFMFRLMVCWVFFLVEIFGIWILWVMFLVVSRRVSLVRVFVVLFIVVSSIRKFFFGACI